MFFQDFDSLQTLFYDGVSHRSRSLDIPLMITFLPSPLLEFCCSALLLDDVFITLIACILLLEPIVFNDL